MFGRYPLFGGQVKITPEDDVIVASAIHDVGIEHLEISSREHPQN